MNEAKTLPSNSHALLMRLIYERKTIMQSYKEKVMCIGNSTNTKKQRH
jgi:hypothetical protein